MIAASHKIGIVGCGWFGLPTGEYFVKQGYQVLGTKRKEEELAKLTAVGIEGYVFDLWVNDGLPKEILEVDTLILNIPAGLRVSKHRDPSLPVPVKSHDEHTFSAAMIKLMEPLLERKTKVIFISTTSVYNSDGHTIEITPTDPQTASGCANLLVEQGLIEKLGKDRVTIMRFSGLIDEERNPANFFAGRVDVTDPLVPVNLVHKTDCIASMEAIIFGNNTAGHWGEILHLSATDHPTKRDFYTWATKQMNLEPPKFVDPKPEDEGKGKLIDPAYTLEKLQLTLQYSSPYMMIAPQSNM